jgi:hypothetical protein
MSGRCLAALIAVVVLVPVPAIGQAPSSERGPQRGSRAGVLERGPQSGSRAGVLEARAATWEQPLTPWGDPDLQGIWNNVTATRLERPDELKDKALLTEEEAAEYERQAAERRAQAEARPHTGYAASIWFETSHTLSVNRTSLLVDPPGGRLPPLTPEAQKFAEKQAEARKLSPADGPEDRGPYERCITRGLPGGMMPGFYNHNYQIFQTRGYVVILVEMIHDARIIPMDGRPHVGTGIRQWLGDSRGRWEGNTLVVETTNLRNIDQRNAAVFGTSEQGRVIERFTRVGADAMDYHVTVEDPATFAQPWTASIPMTRVEGPIYEYACHEGNYGLPNILAGHRKEEKEAAPQR